MEIAQIERSAFKGQAVAAVIGTLLVVLLGTWLRFHRIEAQSLWYDEGNTANMTLRTPDDIVRAAASDIHPPGYYLAVTAWSRVAGRSEFALRGFSALAGIAVLGLMYRLGQEAWGNTGGMLAALLGAVHPALVYYSQEARMYMLASMLGVALVLLTGRILRYSDVGRVRKSCYAYMIVAAAGLYSHYSFAFVIIAINLAVLWRVWGSGKVKAAPLIWNWSGMQLGALILYAPWLPIAIRHLTTWPAERTQKPLFEAGTEMWRWLSLGPTVDASNAVPGSVAIFLLVLGGIIRDRSGVATLWLIAPAALTLAFGLFGGAFAKFLLLSVPAVALLAAGGAASLIQIGENRSITIAILALALSQWYTVKSLVNLFTNQEYYRDDYRAIASMLYENRNSDHAILLNAPNQIEVFSYYYPESARVYPVARRRPLADEEQRIELAQIAAEHHRLTVLYWGDGQSDPNMVVERWLNEHTHKTSSWWYGQVRVVTYSVPERSVRRFEAVDARFGHAIELRGYSVGREAYIAGEVVLVTLSWLPLEKLEKDYTVFVHLYSLVEAPPLAQHDGMPAGGNAPTGSWRVGVEVVDRHGVQLPETISPGEYTLAVGLYLPDRGERLSVSSGSTKGDRLVLGTIAVLE